MPKGRLGFPGTHRPTLAGERDRRPLRSSLGGPGAGGVRTFTSSAPAPQPGQFRAHRAPPAPGPGTPIDRAGWALSPCLALAEGRRFISDQSRRKDLADRPPPGECAGVEGAAGYRGPRRTGGARSASKTGPWAFPGESRPRPAPLSAAELGIARPRQYGGGRRGPGFRSRASGWI